MIQQLKITAVTENTAGCFEALGEWGLALWIEADGHRLLCDAGKGQALRCNAELLKINLAEAEALVVSHGHHDHTGGIAELVALGFRGKVYAHPAAWQSKFQKRDQLPPKSIGVPQACRESIGTGGLEVVSSEGPTQIAPGILLTGAVPRRVGFETITDPFYRDVSCTDQDLVEDDQALLIEMPQGWVVITGCGHSGIINTLNYAKELTGGKLLAVVGGMHLFRASDERLRQTIGELEASGVKIVAACHCTGPAVVAEMQRQTAFRGMGLNAGQTIQFPEGRQFSVVQ